MNHNGDQVIKFIVDGGVILQIEEAKFKGKKHSIRQFDVSIQVLHVFESEIVFQHYTLNVVTSLNEGLIVSATSSHAYASEPLVLSNSCH